MGLRETDTAASLSREAFGIPSPTVPSEALRRAFRVHYGEERGRTADANRAFDEFAAGWLAALKFEREAGQRDRLTRQLQGRERGPVNVADYGTPHFDET